MPKLLGLCGTFFKGKHHVTELLFAALLLKKREGKHVGGGVDAAVLAVDRLDPLVIRKRDGHLARSGYVFVSKRCLNSIAHKDLQRVGNREDRAQ